MVSSSDFLTNLLAPANTAVVTMELQKGIVGEAALLAALPEAVRSADMLPVAGRVCAGARAAGVRVLHATMRERADGAGQAVNCKIFALGVKRRREMGFGPTDIGQPGTELVDELDVQPADIEVPRSHGMTPFNGTELDPIMRNLGITTVVLMGVSLNLGIMGAALSALDLGYQVVIVRDGVCGIPPEYAEAVLQYSLSMIATIITSEELLAVWSAATIPT
jgi:nicotinamidase-related amidase